MNAKVNSAIETLATQLVTRNQALDLLSLKGQYGRKVLDAVGLETVEVFGVATFERKAVEALAKTRAAAKAEPKAAKAEPKAKADGPTLKQLREQAKAKGLKGWQRLTKEELAKLIANPPAAKAPKAKVEPKAKAPKANKTAAASAPNYEKMDIKELKVAVKAQAEAMGVKAPVGGRPKLVAFMNGESAPVAAAQPAADGGEISLEDLLKE
jgi:hypothetical protein